MSIKEVWVPEVLKMQPSAYYAQMRPFRNGGNRLEKTSIAGKTVVHNYGHGGGGISLSAGCCVEAVNLAQDEVPRSVAVIGSGVMGLFTARRYLLTHPSTPLTVYADIIPRFGQKDNGKHITSSVAPGWFFPTQYGSTNLQLHRHLAALSLEEYLKLREDPRYCHCVREADIIDISDVEVYDDYPDKVRESIRKIQVRINNTGKVVTAQHFKGMRIDTQELLELLIQEVTMLGGQFVQRRLSQKDLPGLKEDLIFNCAGVGAREISPDSALRGLKGHLAEYPNPDPEKYNYFLLMNEGNESVALYMHHRRILLGKTKEEVEDTRIDMDQIAHITHNLRQVMLRLGIEKPKPSL